MSELTVSLMQVLSLGSTIHKLFTALFISVQFDTDVTLGFTDVADIRVSENVGNAMLIQLK